MKDVIHVTLDFTWREIIVVNLDNITLLEPMIKVWLIVKTDLPIISAVNLESMNKNVKNVMMDMSLPWLEINNMIVLRLMMTSKEIVKHLFWLKMQEKIH